MRRATTLLLTTLASVAGSIGAEETAAWPQWGGPGRDFKTQPGALVEEWPEGGPPTLWSRPLGNGHSSILVDGDRLYTMYRIGSPTQRTGPWRAEETVIALDAGSGETVWEHTYPSAIQDFGRGAGPHSTPLLVGDRLFTAGSNKRLHALDKKTGDVLWTVDLVADLGAPPVQIRPIVKSGFGCSPIAYGDTVICFAGGPGQSVVALSQKDGSLVWKSGHFLISASSPLLIDVDGQDQLVLFGGSLIAGLDPTDGDVLWAHAHDAGNDFNLSLPNWSGDTLFFSSAYRSGSRALRLGREGELTRVEELWFTNRSKFQFLNTIRQGDLVYGTTGEFATAFFSALDVRTGEEAWRIRGFGQSSLLEAGDKLIVLTEDGELGLVRATPEGAEILARAQVFDTKSWTVPTLVGTTLYARDRARIVALELGEPSQARQPPDLSGTWKLDREAGTSGEGARFPGLGGNAGVPTTLYVTHARNGSIVVGSDMNTSHARHYVPGAGEQPRSGGQVEGVRSEWENGVLTATGREADSGTGFEERLARSADGSTLTVEITLVDGGQRRTGTLLYRAALTEPPCEEWATPCRDFSGHGAAPREAPAVSF